LHTSLAVSSDALLLATIALTKYKALGFRPPFGPAVNDTSSNPPVDLGSCALHAGCIQQKKNAKAQKTP
jgi:hypothetical protein